MTDGAQTEEIIELTNVIEEEKGKPPAPPDIQAELNEIKAALRAQVQAWMAAEGAQILNRVAREMFPKIAADVLREEIARLKAEAEEKE